MSLMVAPPQWGGPMNNLEGSNQNIDLIICGSGGGAISILVEFMCGRSRFKEVLFYKCLRTVNYDTLLKR